MIATGVFLAFVFRFFRDPDRESPEGDEKILAPADGRIISVENWKNKRTNESGQRISIFMNIFNVHVNRSPVSGVITDVVHYPGEYKSAFKPEAERENERTVVQVKTAYGVVTFSQVAGFVARRIVFNALVGDEVQAGDKIGMIKFGSRMDVYLPPNVDVLCSIGEKVTAGETIIGEFHQW